MKSILIFLFTLLIVSLVSCRHEPVGHEITINRMKVLYTQGDIKELTFTGKGSWVLAELTDEAITSKKYGDEINHLMNQGIIIKDTDFRFMVKVVTLQQFITELKNSTGKSPEIKMIK